MELRKLKFKETIIPSKTYWFLLIGLAFAITGMAFNFHAVQSNNGLMPVVSDFNFDSDKHFRISDVNEINYLQLSDIYRIGGNVWSIGDFLMLIGLIFLFLSTYILIHNRVINYLIYKCKKQ